MANDRMTMTTLEYITEHPGCSVYSIARALKLPFDTVIGEVESLVGERIIYRQSAAHGYGCYIREPKPRPLTPQFNAVSAGIVSMVNNAQRWEWSDGR